MGKPKKTVKLGLGSAKGVVPPKPGQLKISSFFSKSAVNVHDEASDLTKKADGFTSISPRLGAHSSSGETCVDRGDHSRSDKHKMPALRRNVNYNADDHGSDDDCTIICNDSRPTDPISTTQSWHRLSSSSECSKTKENNCDLEDGGSSDDFIALTPVKSMRKRKLDKRSYPSTVKDRPGLRPLKIPNSVQLQAKKCLTQIVCRSEQKKSTTIDTSSEEQEEQILAGPSKPASKDLNVKHMRDSEFMTKDQGNEGKNKEFSKNNCLSEATKFCESKSSSVKWISVPEEHKSNPLTKLNQTSDEINRYSTHSQPKHNENVDISIPSQCIESSKVDVRILDDIENTSPNLSTGMSVLSNNAIDSVTDCDKSPVKKAVKTEFINSPHKSRLFITEDHNNSNTLKKPVTVLTHSPSKQLDHSQGMVCDSIDEFLDDFVFEEWNVSSQSAKVSELHSLCLKKLHRCSVIGIDQVQGKRDKILHLQSTASGLTTSCLLKGFWCDYDLTPGSVVSIVGSPSQIDFVPWLVDHTEGFLIVNPDLLISGTAVVGSLFCKRRSVLSTHYQGLDSESRVMVIGILVHNLLQMVLKKKLYQASQIKKVAEDLIRTPDSIKMLYTSGLSLSETLKELFSFVPHIVNFISCYVKDDFGAPSLQPSSRHNWKGKITSVHDIEENMWVPKLGLKGKIDITAEVRVHNRKRGRAPIELKTGKASWDAQHKGQVILYKLMMMETGTDVDTGLLLYLRSGEMGTVEESHAEQAGLINLRNELASYLTLNKSSNLKRLVLPEPINHHSACGKCPYLTLCSSYLLCDGLDRVANNNPLKQLITPATSHLEPQHIEYFMHFSRLLLLEENSSATGNSTVDLWTLTPQQRAERGTCLCNLSITSKPKSEFACNEYTFQQLFSTTPDLRNSTLSPGEYVALSTDSRVAVHTGRITDITSSTVSVALDRSVNSDFEKAVFHIDSLSSYNSSTLNMTFLSLLMEDSVKAEKLRRTVIDRTPPTFADALPSKVAKEGKDILSQLNANQKLAVLKTLYANDYLLIKGMPGTGKTSTIATLVSLLVKLGESVLVVAHTHSAVDNMLLKIKDRGVDVLRLGASSRTHPDLREYGEKKLYETSHSPDELEKQFMSKPVVGCTCLGMGHALLTRRNFSTCIVDESTQALQCTVLRSIFITDKFILVGDPDQLSPLVRCQEARDLGLSESLFARLDQPVATIVLKEQYRMNQTLTDLANGLTYAGRLQCGSPEVANATLKLDHYPESPSVSLPQASWLKLALSAKLEHAVMFLDTGNILHWKDNEKSGKQENYNENKCKNICEAAIIVRYITKLKMGGIAGSAVGVIAPYRAQVALLTQLTGFMEGIEVNTVDQFQGRDKEVIVYSCTRSDVTNVAKDSEILHDKRRLTVAITRAKHKLVIVGDVATLRKYEPFRLLLDCLNEWQIVPLRDGCDGFFWAPLISETKALLTI